MVQDGSKRHFDFEKSSKKPKDHRPSPLRHFKNTRMSSKFESLHHKSSVVTTELSLVPSQKFLLQENLGDMYHKFKSNDIANHSFDEFKHLSHQQKIAVKKLKALRLKAKV